MSLQGFKQPARLPSQADALSAPPQIWQRFLGRRSNEAMSDDDRAYFQTRAEAEIALAQHAGHPGAVRAHFLLAGYYLDLVHCRSSAPERVPLPEHEDARADA